MKNHFCNIIKLILLACSIDNSFSLLLKKIDLNNLRSLQLSHDSIGNKGMKAIFKLNVDKLIEIKLNFVGVTKDVVRTFNKHTRLFFHIHICFKHKDHFIPSELFYLYQ